MKIADSREMAEIDRLTITDFGIPSMVLMERAGLAVADVLRECVPVRRVLVVSGAGNNGGDGLAAARIIYGRGYTVRVLLVAREDSLSTECALQLRLARKIGVPVEFRTIIEPRDIHGACVIDAVFGTGLNRPVLGDLSDLFETINKFSAPVVSVDIPSGVSADTGDVLGAAIRATYTVTFGLPKRGHYLHPGAGLAGRLFIEDIGFPRSLTDSPSLKLNLIDRDMVLPLVPPRRPHSHKGTYGHVLVVGGSLGKTGAAILSAGAALRSGTGLVTLGVPLSLAAVFQSKVTDEMVCPLPDDGSGTLSYPAAEKILDFVRGKIDVVALGPGLGRTSDTARLVRSLVEHCEVPLVIDADGLNALSHGQDSLNSAKAPIILTPHPGEMRALLAELRPEGERATESLSSADVDRNRIEIARSYASKMKTHVVLKGAPTVVAGPAGDAFLNSTGNPGMATAGAGDVLTGIIASLVGQGLSPGDASLLGVYLHGLAGDYAARGRGQRSVIASDIVEHISDALRSLEP